MAADHFSGWLAALEARHLADLRLAEVTRALRALSSAYVERRHALARGAALDGAGKRAAFALFYAPIHFLVVREVVRGLGAPPPRSIVDLGCGIGAGGAAWALESRPPARVLGIDRNRWAVQEARWTYRHFGLHGDARQGDLARFRPSADGTGALAAYTLNELSAEARVAALDSLIRHAERGAPVLVIEPIARAAAPWWHEARRAVERGGGRADEWILPLDLPPLVAKLDRAAGLDHRRVKARSLFVAGDRGARPPGG